MCAALAPVEALPRECPSLLAGPLHVHTEPSQDALAGGGQDKVAVHRLQKPPAEHRVRHQHTEPARQMVVAGFALGAGCTMAGNLLGGWLSDRFGREWVFAVGSMVAIAGIGGFAVMKGPDDLPLLVLYAASGVGFGMRIAQLSSIPADIFSGPHLGAILGVVQAGGGLGGAVGPFLGGWLFDVTGSYRLAFMAAAIAVAGSAVAAWFAARPRGVDDGGDRMQ
jgi:MFS family permease